MTTEEGNGGPGLRLYLVRHGQVPQVTPRRFLGQRDVPLDDEGLGQVRALGASLADVPFDAAFCSDLVRARETARLVLEGRGLTARPTPGLREIALGAWEGLSVDEVRARFPGEYERRGLDMAGYRPAGGESFQDVQDRAVRFLHGLEPLAGVVLAVAHGGFNRTLLCHVAGRPLAELFSIDQAYCCLNVLERTAGRWAVVEMNAVVG
jgi:probable phosphoglycerate mutase